MPDPVVVRCPMCSQKYRISPALVGHRARCKTCGAMFRIVSEQPIDDDTIVGWITSDDPSSQSVTGSTGMFDDLDGLLPRPARNAAGGAAGGPGVRLASIEEGGAWFEFSAELLVDEAVRNGFSRKCVGCGARAGLHVHLVYWPEKMLQRDPLKWSDHVDVKIGRLETYPGYGDRSILLQLPMTRHVGEPYTLPFPVFACEWCLISREIEAHVAAEEGGEICRLRVAYLPSAVSFLRNTGGRETPDYARLLEERDRRRDPWRELAPATRNRVVRWYVPKADEQFVQFFADTEMAGAEVGTFGIVLTDRRLVLRKYGSTRDFPLNRPGRLEYVKKGDHATMHICDVDSRPAVAHLDLEDMDRLVAALQAAHCRWTMGR